MGQQAEQKIQCGRGNPAPTVFAIFVASTSSLRTLRHRLEAYPTKEKRHNLTGYATKEKRHRLEAYPTKENGFCS